MNDPSALTRNLWAALLIASLSAGINFVILASIPYETTNDHFQDIFLGTLAGVLIGTTCARLVWRFSVRRAFAWSLTGVAFGWVGGIAITYVLAVGFQSLLPFGVLRTLRRDPWLMAISVWFVGPFVSLARPSTNFADGRGRVQSASKWFATLAIAIPLAFVLYVGGFAVSFYGGGRGLVTLGTASIVAPWLGFIIGDHLVRAVTDRSRRERRWR